MDRDPRENVVDPVERVSPATGENDTGDVGDEQARILRERRKRETEPGGEEDTKAPKSDRTPGRKG